MKKVLVALLVATAVLAIALVSERLLTGAGVGPAAMVALSALGLIFLALLVTLLCQGTRFQGTITNIWLVVISVGVTYIAVDLAAGYLLIKPLSPPLAPDEYRHHKLIPNTHSYFEQRDFTYYQRVNNVGLRGRDIALKKPADHFRILMLGDSFTMGKGVEDDQTFSVLLERALNSPQNRWLPKSVEVLNGGVDSYAPILSHIQLAKELGSLEPDLVVLNLDNSDLVQETAYRSQAVLAPDGVVAAVPGTKGRESLNDRIRSWTEGHLYLSRLLLFYTNKLFDYKSYSVRSMVTQANLEIAKHTLAEDAEDREGQWQAIFESILRIKRYCDERSIGFALAVYPWGHQVNDKEWVPGRANFIPDGSAISDRSLERILRFATVNGVNVVNMFPAFRAYHGSEPLYFKYDNHMTTEGHRLMAKEFERHLREQPPRRGT